MIVLVIKHVTHMEDVVMCDGWWQIFEACGEDGEDDASQPRGETSQSHGDRVGRHAARHPKHAQPGFERPTLEEDGNPNWAQGG